MPEEKRWTQFTCPSCGSGMEFNPESGQLKCTHCGSLQALIAGSEVVAHEFTGTVANHLLQPITAAGASGKLRRVRQRGGVRASGSRRDMPLSAGGDRCAPKAADPLIAPDGVLPVKLPKPGALNQVKQWLSSRWFAPNA